MWASSLRQYGVSLVWYLAQLQYQDGRCAICHQVETKKHPRTGQVFRLAVDHDHKTGKPRGLLCMRCNVLLAFIEDPFPVDIDLIMGYLDTYKGLQS